MGFSKIKKIESIGEKQTYDITVNNNHNFLCNGHVIHNSGYRGELKIILTNHGSEVFHIKNGDRIAQCIFSNALTDKWVGFEEVNQKSDNTERNITGFGSSGIK